MARHARRNGVRLVLAAALAGAARGQQFVTELSGLGGTPIGLTPIGQSGTTTMDVNWLTSTDPDAVCNGAKQP